MEQLDFNLLNALDMLLADGSVTEPARRPGLSSSAMSRTLTRLRSATGDPLLVRAGRGPVPTPCAAGLRDRVHELTRDVRAVPRPQIDHVDSASLELTFTIRVSEAFLEFLSVTVVSAMIDAAPLVRLRFAPKPDKDARPHRDGLIDLEIGVLGTPAPEIRTQLLFHDRLVGIARSGHPLLLGQGATPERYGACRHVVASRDGNVIEPIDVALKKAGLGRTVSVVVPGYPDAMRIARRSELVAVVPESCLGNRPARDQVATPDLESFELPVSTPAFKISAMWHPRWMQTLRTVGCGTR